MPTLIVLNDEPQSYPIMEQIRLGQGHGFAHVVRYEEYWDKQMADSEFREIYTGRSLARLTRVQKGSKAGLQLPF